MSLGQSGSVIVHLKIWLTQILRGKRGVNQEEREPWSCNGPTERHRFGSGKTLPVNKWVCLLLRLRSRATDCWKTEGARRMMLFSFTRTNLRNGKRSYASGNQGVSFVPAGLFRREGKCCFCILILKKQLPRRGSSSRIGGFDGKSDCLFDRSAFHYTVFNVSIFLRYGRSSIIRTDWARDLFGLTIIRIIELWKEL